MRRDGATRIADERKRQVASEGYDVAHDDEHDDGGLAMAAACYAAPRRIYEQKDDSGAALVFRDPWPWSEDDDKRPYNPNTCAPAPERTNVEQRIRLLEKAGALCAAEIDRLLRKKRRKKQ